MRISNAGAESESILPVGMPALIRNNFGTMRHGQIRTIPAWHETWRLPIVSHLSNDQQLSFVPMITICNRFVVLDICQLLSPKISD